MLSMSNQFYNYISDLLINHFKKIKLKAGDRFYLQLDRESDVTNLLEALKNVNGIKQFRYKHEQGEMYETFSIPFGSINLVVASTSNGVKPDFLVTLRNLVGEQKDEWTNTALISIVSEQLDSIQGGSSDLQKEGMPLHPNSIFKKLQQDIKNSGISKIDQIILDDSLEMLIKEQAYQQVTFFEFEDIFSVMQKGSIEDREYAKFGLFKDTDLQTYTGKALKNRIQDNRDLFEFVKKVHDYGLEKDELEKKFTSEGANALIKEDWNEQLYSQVHKYHEDYLKINKTLKVELQSPLKASDRLTFWDKPLNENAAGQRKRHIIIFNPKGQSEVELQASFSFSGNVKSLSSSFLTVAKSFQPDVQVDVKKSNIFMKISAEANKPTFVRVTYKHDKKANLGADFYIAVLPIEASAIDAYQSKYFIDTNNRLIDLNYEEGTLKFGEGIAERTEELATEGQTVKISKDEKVLMLPLSEAFNDDEELAFNVQFDEALIPFLVKNEANESTPIRGQRIWKLIREHRQDFHWNKENNRLIFENREFYFHAEYKSFFEWEDQWIEQGMKYGILDSGILLHEDIQLDEDLREAYSRYINYFKIKKSIPSLSYLSEELKERSMDYLNNYQRAVESFEEDQPAGRKGLDLFKLGTVYANDELYFTPFHPLMVAFKLKVYELLKSEEVDNSILNRINVEALVPFLYDDRNKLYKPEHQQAAMEWLQFKPVNKVSVSDASQYLAKVVNDKITQFKEHFSYLFASEAKAPIQINVININNDYEVIRGILQWMLTEIDHAGPENLKAIEVTLYKNENAESAFDLYAQTDSVDRFEELFNVKLKSTVYDKEDLLRAIREKLFFYKRNLDEEIRYAHITYYKMQAQEHHAIQKADKMISGIAIDGLYTSVPSMRDTENYKSGFGIKNYKIEKDNYLTSTAYYVNELAANTKNSGTDSYHKGEVILSRTTLADESTLNKIFAASHWVTFVDPTVDLEFFQKYNSNLIVIHYSDQYSSSSRYDAITVTNRWTQYSRVIKEFLVQKDVEDSESNVDSTIKAFNTFNGEWLLRIIGSKGHYDREKLSIISAIKYALSYFDHSDIIWVPISLEEILRVAGVVNLSKTDGVFTAKNLGVKGSHSDDLLLLGLENNNQILNMHFYPIEVKIGNNQANVLDKAKEQAVKTKKLFDQVLTGDEGDTFRGRFYRNFFVQLFIANAKKLAQSDFWNEKHYELSDEMIEKLLKNQFSISNSLEPYIGKGGILSFRKDAIYRSAHKEDDVLLLDFTMMDGYSGLVKPMKEMRDWMQLEQTDLIKEDMLSRHYKAGSNTVEVIPQPERTDVVPESYQSEDGVLEKEENQSVSDESKEEQDSSDELVQVPEVDEAETQNELDDSQNQTHKKELKDVRIKIGRAENSNREIYWEYGNQDLANRHLLISGKSGQGKTYFMQCLLLEKSKQGIPSIVIDYTEGFLPNQLEPEFVESLGAHLKQAIVYSEKLPINPFQKNERDIGGIKIPEQNTDVAERIKSVFAAVYKSLGIQQLNAIYEAVLNGLDRYDNQMSLVHLRDMLEEDGSSQAKTALSQIRPLIDRNPFQVENTMNWADIVQSDGDVFVIQLTGYPRDVQLIITEFILWDLWNYSVRHGNKNKPMPVIMDEAQNLDHTEKSPSARILQEGRKFGWSAWYATQFLKSQLDADELARLQNSSEKIYFAPPEQELSNIAASLSKDPQEKKYWEGKLATLKKGQCIVHGPVRLENGELSNPVVTLVDIAPLSERI